jgi:hypothetical protein
MRIVGNRVLGHMGDVLAEKIYGQWESKDPAVLDFINQQNKPVKKAVKKPVVSEEKLEMVRARDEEGQFIADDPTTPEVNEAWVVKTVKKVKKK